VLTLNDISLFDRAGSLGMQTGGGKAGTDAQYDGAPPVRTASELFGFEDSDWNHDATTLEGHTSSPSTVAGWLSTGEPDTEGAPLKIYWVKTVADRRNGKEVYQCLSPG